MGSVCCCLSFDDFEDYVNPNSPVYRNCVCLSCLVQNLLNVVCLYILSSSWFMEGQFSVLCFAVHNLNLIGPPPQRRNTCRLHCICIFSIVLLFGIYDLKIICGVVLLSALESMCSGFAYHYTLNVS